MANIKMTDYNPDEDVEDLELLYTVSRNVKWYNYFGKEFSNFLKGQILPYDPIIPRYLSKVFESTCPYKLYT